MEQDFIEAGTTLLLQCEEGETEYEEAFLDKHDIKLLEVEKPEQLNLNFSKTVTRSTSLPRSSSNITAPGKLEKS